VLNYKILLTAVAALMSAMLQHMALELKTVIL